MKNHEYIRSLSEEELAKVLVKETVINDREEDCDGDMQDNYMEIYVTPDGIACDNYDDAVESTVYWLNLEHDESEE